MAYDPKTDSTWSRSTMADGLVFKTEFDKIYQNINHVQGSVHSPDSAQSIELSEANMILLNYQNGSVSGDISVQNGIPGSVYYLIVRAGVTPYGFVNIKWPSGIAPVPSAEGKRDMYCFVCAGIDDYLGTFAFNYD